jgi:DNA-binding SARP family transcriptional activator
MDERLLSFAGSGDGVFAVDSEQRILFWNNALAGLLGISAEDALHYPCWQILQGRGYQGEPFCAPDCPLHRRARLGETLVSTELVLRSRNGTRLGTRISHISPGHERAAEEPYFVVHLVRQIAEPAEQAGKLRIQLLGQTNVWLPGGTLVSGGAWANKKVRCLIGYLALQPNLRATRAQMQADLWPELEEKQQRAALNDALAALRHCLEDSHPWRYLGGNGVLRLTGECWVDAAAFDRRIHCARLQLDVGEGIGCYQEALALYRGYYASDLDSMEPWCLDERARLHALYLAAMEELGLLYESVGLKQAALTMYYRLLEVEPEHAGARRHLFRLAGQPGESIAVVRTCTWLARTLSSELDRLGGELVPNSSVLLAAG